MPLIRKILLPAGSESSFTKHTNESASISNSVRSVNELRCERADRLAGWQQPSQEFNLRQPNFDFLLQVPKYVYRVAPHERTLLHYLLRQPAHYVQGLLAVFTFARRDTVSQFVAPTKSESALISLDISNGVLRSYAGNQQPQSAASILPP